MDLQHAAVMSRQDTTWKDDALTLSSHDSGDSREEAPAVAAAEADANPTDDERALPWPP